MSQQREDFRNFLRRIAENSLRADDWRTFAVEPIADEELESLRRSLVEQSAAFPDWSVGWIPRRMQDIGRGLAECLREFPADSVAYRTEWFSFDEQGTLSLRASWSDSETMSHGWRMFPATHQDYAFWTWVVASPERRKGIKRSAD